MENVITEPEQRRPRGTSNTSAATAARVLKKRRRWAAELLAAGWTVLEPGAPPVP
jgi:hypothetical protein